MIALDTNVISETMKASPSPQVIGWLNAQEGDALFVTSITIAEILLGIALLDDGKRKYDLASSVDALINKVFAGRVLPFDDKAANYYASIVVKRKKIGKPISFADAQIAAICVANGYAIATRNTKDFEEIGIKVINPWE
jgi:predicted nucleic acid-binding protein